jgi:hypothetical protein
MGNKKQSTTAPVQFLFIDDTQSSNKAQKRRIRQHAMRNVAATRKELGTYRKVNTGQYPIFIEQEPSSVFVDKVYATQSWERHPDESDTSDISDYPYNLCTIPCPMPPNDYELARSTFDFDIVSLSWLTSFHFSAASARALSRNLTRFRCILKPAHDVSYLDYVPQLYGQSVLIRRVVDCVLARARKTVSVDGKGMDEQDILNLYGKALVGLQSALGEEGRRWDADVLCSTQLLAMYEVGCDAMPLIDFGMRVDLFSFWTELRRCVGRAMWPA